MAGKKSRSEADLRPGSPGMGNGEAGKRGAEAAAAPMADCVAAQRCLDAMRAEGGPSEEMARLLPVRVIVPRPGLCTDNAAMIGAAAYFRLRDDTPFQWDLDIIPNLKLG